MIPPWTAAAVLCLLCVLATPTAPITLGKSTQYEGIKVSRVSEERQSAWSGYLARSSAARLVATSALAAEQQGMTEIPLGPLESLHDSSVPVDKPAGWYGLAEAQRTADIIVSYQIPTGGWGKNLDFSERPRAKGQAWAPQQKGFSLGTIDNGATTSQIWFLARAAAAANQGDKEHKEHKEPGRAHAWRAGVLKGLDYLLAAELPCGGWPLAWPLDGNYHDALTFNDNAIANAMRLLQAVCCCCGGGGGDQDDGDLFGFVPADVKEKARAALHRARSVVVATQIVVGGNRTGWCQQYNPVSMRPVAARNYEPVAIASVETVAVLLQLMRLEDPTPREAEAVHAGVAWLKAAAIHDTVWEGRQGELATQRGAPLLWARFYAMTRATRPIFGDRDQSVHDDVREISLERRRGYDWYTTIGALAITAYERWAKKHSHRGSR